MRVARQKPLKLQKKWLINLALVLFVGAIEQQGWLISLRSHIQPISAPLLVDITRRLEILLSPFTLLRNREATVKRLSQLEYEQAQALATISDLQLKSRQTVALRRLLEKSSPSSKSIITAARVSYAQPEIAAGSMQGVQEQMLVFVAQTLVGKIQKVYENRAVVRLLSDPREKSIIAVTDSGVQGLIIGDGQSVFLSLIPQDKQIVVGEKVTTVGQAHVPAGLFIGTVSETKGDLAEPTKKVKIEQYVSFFTTPLVTVQ